MKAIALVATAAFVLIGTAASAKDGDDWAFKLVNKSQVDAIQFYTKGVSGKWSADWLKTPVKPGETRALRFNGSSDTRCEIETRIVFSDQSEFDTPVKYCDTDNVVVTDKEIFTQ